MLDFGRGMDVFGKVKYIHETDKRLNDAKYLPYQDGDCPGGGVACAGNKRFYGEAADGTQNSTADLYGNPGLVIAGRHRAGYQWKPFDNISDDDRELNYVSANLGAGLPAHRRPVHVASATPSSWRTCRTATRPSSPTTCTRWCRASTTRTCCR